MLMDAATLTKTALPDHVRAALTGGAQGRVTDHAGYQCVKP